MNGGRSALLGELFPDGALEEGELVAVAGLFTAEKHPAGHRLIDAGSTTRTLFVLVDGVVEVLGSHEGSEYHLHDMSGRTILGEMSFLDREQRSATVRAQTPISVLALTHESLAGVAKSMPDLEHRLTLALSRVVIQRLRRSTAAVVEEMNLRNQFGRFVVLLITAFSLITWLLGSIESIQRHVSLQAVALGASLFGLAVSFLAVRAIGEPWSSFGLHLGRWRANLMESFVVCAFLTGVALLILPEADILGWLASSPSLALVAYLLVAFLQELVCRGLLQTGLMKFLDDRRGLVSVAVASLIFSAVHVLHGPVITSGSFLMGMLLGLVYLRQRSLLGVTIIHFWIGVLAGVLGIMSG